MIGGGKNIFLTFIFMSANNNKKPWLLILPHTEKELLKIADEMLEVQRLDDLAEKRKKLRKAKTVKTKP